MELSKYKTDETLEREGVWVDMGDGFHVRIARDGNPKHSAAVSRLTKPFKQQIRRGTLGQEKLAEIAAQAMAEAIVLDWQGLYDDGKEIPYSQEKAYEILYNYPDLRRDIADLSSEMETFRAMDEEEAAGNSGNASAGSSSGGSGKKS